MTKMLAALLALLPLLASANPPAGGGADLRYAWDGADAPSLKSYDGEPWWSMLAQCAGYHIAASELVGIAQPQVDMLRNGASHYALLASLRLAKDRGRGPGSQPEVEQLAFDAADKALASELVADMNHVASMVVLCDAQRSAYARRVPGMLLEQAVGRP